MDKEIFYIQSVFFTSNEALTTGEISKLIFEKFNYKISKKIVQNYLWSYFREDIEYNPESFSYRLKIETTGIDNFTVNHITNSKRSISMVVEGSNVKIEIDKNLNIEKLAIAIVSLNIKGYNSRYDLIKNLNRILDNL
ncbi:MAG: hypothetical protein KUL74_09100 [Cloacibacterium sp.]|nr:hypothetical protein [Cloacibacterium sp.]